MQVGRRLQGAAKDTTHGRAITSSTNHASSITEERSNMLVLTRKRTESIHIGDDIKVTIVRVDGDKVRLGIEAPRNIMIAREELREKPEDKPDKSEPDKPEKPTEDT